jgi:hypothetical protein
MDAAVAQWYDKLPQSQKHDPDTIVQGNSIQYALRICLYLRMNQTRLAISHPIFLSPAALVENINFAESAVEIAKDLIRILKYFAQTQYLLSNYFLMSPFTTIFLAAMQAPEHFSISTREEFYLALEMIRAERPDSFAGKRLLRMMKVLTQAGHLFKQNNSSEMVATPASTSSAATYPPEMISQTQQTITLVDTIDATDKKENMVNDLMNLFETPIQGQGQDVSRQDCLTRIFKDLF